MKHNLSYPGNKDQTRELGAIINIGWRGSNIIKALYPKKELAPLN